MMHAWPLFSIDKRQTKLCEWHACFQIINPSVSVSHLQIPGIDASLILDCKCLTFQNQNLGNVCAKPHFHLLCWNNFCDFSLFNVVQLKIEAWNDDLNAIIVVTLLLLNCVTHDNIDNHGMPSLKVHTWVELMQFPEIFHFSAFW